MRKRTAFFVGAAGMRIIATASVRTGCGNDRVTQEVRWGGRTEASAPTKMCCRGEVLPRPREGQSPSPTHSSLRNTAKKRDARKEALRKEVASFGFCNQPE